MIRRGVALVEALSFDDVLLVPKRTRAKSRSHVDLGTRLTPRIALRIPLISANTPWCTEATMAVGMARLGGVGFVHRMCTRERQAELVAQVKAQPFSREQFPDASVDARGRLLVGAAVGVTDDYLIRAELLIEAGADVLVVDIAHGHADHMLDALHELKRAHPELEVVAGNVATAEAARELIDAGADAIKVGIGPGSICTTRVVTGSGMPQITAVIDCAEEARKRNVPVIADGGIRTSGDIVKALAAGASSVMVGGMLAGTDESAAHLVEVDGERYKITTGFVTLGVRLTLRKQRKERVERDEFERYVPEGVEATFKYSGALVNVVSQTLGGVRSGMSYSGAMSLAELWEKAEFVRVSANGVAEGKPHALGRSRQVHPDYAEMLVE